MMKNPIPLDIPLLLSDGRTINTLYCATGSDEIEGYTLDQITTGDEVLVDLQFRSSGDKTNHSRRAFVVIIAHRSKYPDHLSGVDCTHFHASVRTA
jgi:hypothetical protein